MGAMIETKPLADRDDADILAMINGWREDSEPHWQSWRKDAQLAFAFEAGDQWTKQEKAELDENNRVAPVMNRIRPMCKAVAGAEITNRQETKFHPREVNDSGYAQFVTAAVDYIRDETGAEHVESDAFYDAIVAGVGCVQYSVEYDQDPAGRHVQRRVDPMAFGVEATCIDRGFGEARYIWHDQEMSLAEFREEYGDDIEPGAGGQRSMREHTTYSHDQYGRGGTGDQLGDADVVVTQWQWFERVPYHRVEIQHPDGRVEQAEMGQDQFEQWQSALEQLAGLGMQMQSVRMLRRVYFRAFVTGDTVIEWGELPDQQYTYKFITGELDRNRGMFEGIVKALVDPQRMANKLWSTIAGILDASAKGGVLAEETAIPDIREFEETWTAADSVSVVADGAISQARVKEKSMVAYPTGYDRLYQHAVEAFPQVTGINPEMLGLADREQAGVLEMQRRQAAYGTLSTLFDALTRFRKAAGKLTLAQLKYLGPRMIRIVGEDGNAQYAQFAMQGDHNQYDVIVDEAATSPNRKQEVMAVLMQLIPLFQGAPMAPQILAEFVKYLPLPETMTNKLAQALGQPSPEQQQQKQLAQAGQQANVQKTQGEAALKHAQARKAEAEAGATAREGMAAAMMQNMGQFVG